MQRLLTLSLCVFAFLTPACKQPLKGPDLGGLYDRAAMSHEAERNPVIVIPGILGSKLKTPDGRVAWGAFGGDAVHPGVPDDIRLLALPMKPGVPLDELTDDLQPDGALDRVRFRLLYVPVQVRAYADILATLGVGGFRDQQLAEADAVDYGDEHFTCFQFSYDWRRDNVENARLLGEFIEDRKAYVEAELKRRYGIERDVKFDIVAHSMGGLLTRWWLRYGDAELTDAGDLPEVTWAGAKNVDRVILVGTPSFGSISSLQQLVHGSKLAPFLPRYDPAILGTMPSIYQLLPRERHGALANAEGDPFDAALWEQQQWGLVSPRAEQMLEIMLPEVDDPEERRAIAKDHLAKLLNRADRFQQALDTPADLPDELELHLFAGDAADTDSAVEVLAPGKVKVINPLPGDGTVPRYSALADERQGGEWSAGLKTPIDWSHVTFLFDDHIGLTKSPVFADNLLYLLLEAPRD